MLTSGRLYAPQYFYINFPSIKDQRWKSALTLRTALPSRIHQVLEKVEGPTDRLSDNIKSLGWPRQRHHLSAWQGAVKSVEIFWRTSADIVLTGPRRKTKIHHRSCRSPIPGRLKHGSLFIK